VKNLMGCVVGTDKRLMHQDLAANLVAINELIKPDWILVDGLIGMEGNGPGDGIPKPVNILVSATNAFHLDLLVARLMGLNRANIPYLTIAHHKGYITYEDIEQVDNVEPITTFEPPPVRGVATRALDHQVLTGLRDLTRPIHSSEAVRGLLYRLGIIQDVYKQADAQIDKLTLDQEKCNDCGRCLGACPVQLPVTSPDFDFSASSGCLGCLYCALVCPQCAIIMHGDLGYLADHLERYGDSFRCL
jgi:Pyruvate/2-oxoacid:ferredoxin oxidoreductase delta subunit